jgi:UDP-N-acetylmuramate--alanine ligase
MKTPSSLLVDGRGCSWFHLAGILGSGMSAIAQYLAWHGCAVSGSDRSAGSADTAHVRTGLEKLGCRIVPQDGSGVVPSLDAVVVSTAIEESNPDIAAARTRGIRVVHRSDVLAAIVQTRRTIAVAGTSGKSTVTALCFDLLRGCGRSPSLISGANLVSLSAAGLVGNACYGRSDLLVIEADESDGSIVKYHPEISLILNVSRDHKTVDETMDLFAALAAQSTITIVNEDDHALAALPHNGSFGLAASAVYHPDHVDSFTPLVRFSRGRHAFESCLIGEHNLSNILAALAACSTLGCADAELAGALTRFVGLERRFSRVSGSGRVVVIDDYAHNPAKVEAVVRTAQSLSPRVIAIFQPHGYGPIRFMRVELIDALARTLRTNDESLMMPIYYAGGTVQKDIASADLVDDLNKRGARSLAPVDRQACLTYLQRIAQPGDLILSMGARDPSLGAFARQIAQALNG